MAVDDARRVPWRGDWDEVVLRLLASGVVDLADHIASGQPVRLPYPVSLQRALDRLSVICIASGKQPPRSVADLLRWCQLPLGKWEMLLAGDEADDVPRCGVRHRHRKGYDAVPTTSMRSATTPAGRS